MGSNFKPALDLSSWKGATQPNHKDILKGRFVSLEPLSTSHHQDLYKNLAQSPDSDPVIWRFMPTMPEENPESYLEFIKERSERSNEYFYTIVDNSSNEALGWLALIAVNAPYGSIEIGHVTYSKKLQRTAKGTEAFYLLAKHCIVDLSFRRVEWKCDAANERSKNAAKRYGFTFEGIFRKHMVIRGINRDTAWFSLLDDEWERVGKAFEDWLSEENMSQDGIQKERLRVSSTLLLGLSYG